MKLKVKRVHENAKLPTRAYSTDAGLDLYLRQKIEEEKLNGTETRAVG